LTSEDGLHVFKGFFKLIETELPIHSRIVLMIDKGDNLILNTIGDKGNTIRTKLLVRIVFTTVAG
jgi:hypothetical protein